MHPLRNLLLVLAACLGLLGCGDRGFTLTKEELAAFKDATPEIKQLWEQGLKADKANDFATASKNYRALLAKTITPDQLAAVQTALGGLNYRLNDAAAKGDAAAKQALETSKESAPKR